MDNFILARGAQEITMSDDIKNWMHLFRWIVKHIRDEYGIDEGLLNRTAVLEQDLGIGEETIEEIVEIGRASCRERV